MVASTEVPPPADATKVTIFSGAERLSPDQVDQRRRFLDELATTGNFSSACRAGALRRRHVNVLLQCDAEFALAFEEAMEEASDILEAEAWRRALGPDEPVVKGGQPVMDPVTGQALVVRRYSDALLMLLLRASKPARFARQEKPRGRDNAADIIREIQADDDPPRREPKSHP